jgi:competence protein ComEA
MKNKEKIIGSVAILLVFFIFFIYGIFRSNSKEEKVDDSIFVETSSKINSGSKSDNLKVEDKKSENTTSKLIKVQIKGEVKAPGVYNLNIGDRVEDLIKLAGGFTVEADVDKVVSQAKKLKDEECILVPRKGAINNIATVTEPNVVTNNMSSSIGGKININIATKEDLMKVPGIGEVIASNIIDYREKNGGFNSLEDLKNIDRIGDKTFEKFKEKLDIN